ncbi:hypothetical protein D3C85_1461810 [compost metagenome]
MLVSCQQCGGHLGVEVTVLRQQLVILLKDAPPSGALNLGGQSTFAMKTLNDGLLKCRTAILAIQRIVMVAAQYGFTG